MNRRSKVVALSFLALLPAGAGPPDPAVRDTAAVADRIVNQSANVKYGEMVLIEGGTRDQQLLEDIAVEVRKLGAHPLIVIGSDRLTRRLLADVDERYDEQQPTFGLRLAEIIDARITVEHSQRPDLQSGIPAERIAARAKAGAAVDKRLMERGVVNVHLGNGLYPTEALSKEFGISYDDLTKLFWKGVNADYARIGDVGQRVAAALGAGKEVRITAPNGTDLTVNVAGRPVFVSDGVVSGEDRYAGGPSCQVWLPAGEVYLAPVPGTARGTFVADAFSYQGKRIEKLTLVFADGRLTSMTAASDIADLKERFEAAQEGRDLFGALDIGINESVAAPAGSRVATWRGAGTISVGIGGNTWAGGDNEVPYGLYAHLLSGTLSVDGKPVVEGGKLKAES